MTALEQPFHGTIDGFWPIGDRRSPRSIVASRLSNGIRVRLVTAPTQCIHPVYWATEFEVVPLQRNPLGEFFFPIKLDGRKIEATFSTGTSVTTLSTDVTKRVYGFDKDSTGIETQKDSDGMVVASYRAMKMSTSGLSVIDERVKLVDPPHRCELTRKADLIGSGCLYFYPLRLGNSILEHLHIYIDTKSNVLHRC